MTFEGHCDNFFFFFFTFLLDVLETKKKNLFLTLPLLMVLTEWPCWAIYQQHLHTTQAKEHCIMESTH